MKPIRLAVGMLALLVCLCVILSCLHAQALNRAARYNAYVILHKALRSLAESGHLPNASANGADLSLDASTFWIDGKRFDAVIGMRWHGSSAETFVISRDGSVIEIDKRVPKVIAFPTATGT